MDFITLSVSKYESKAICNYPQGVILLRACLNLLQRMPASTKNSAFIGPDDAKITHAYSRLPHSFITSKYSYSLLDVPTYDDENDEGGQLL